MASIRSMKENWEGLAQFDPLWTICSDPAKRGRKWTQEDFFETGKKEIQTVFKYLHSLGIVIDNTASALDFGCGAGRLTRALGQHFTECWGVDISPTMIQLAQECNRAYPNCHFRVNEADDLQSFADGQFGFIYTSIVLQHIEREYALRYLFEFVRLLKQDGILVFQIADSRKRDLQWLLGRLRRFVDPGNRLNRLLKRKGVGGLRMDMHCIREEKLREVLSTCGVKILDVRLTNSTDPSFNGGLCFLDRKPDGRFVSKQYCIVKTSSSPL